MSLLTLLRKRRNYGAKLLSVQRAALLAYWPLSELSGTTAADASGNGRTGSYVNAVPGAQGVGDGRTAAGFDGTSDAINVYSASLRDAFNGSEGSLMAWAKVSGAGVWTDAANRNIVRVDSATAGNLVFIRKTTTNNTLQLRYSAGSTDKIIATTAFGGALGWLHVALTWSKAADQVKAYVNGAQIGATQTSLGTWAGLPTSGAVAIGAASSIGAEAWAGSIAHVALWSTPLSAAEVARLAGV